MGVAVGWWSLFTGLTAAGSSYVTLLIIRFLFGFGEGPQGSVTVKTMRNWFPQKQMGTSVGISQGFTPLGGAVGTPIVAWLIATYGDWRVPFVVFGVLGILMAIGWWVIVRDTPADHPLGYQQDIDDVAQGAIVAEHAVTHPDAEGAAPLGFYLRHPLVLSTGAAFFAYAWVLYTFLTWFPIYLVQERGVNLKEVASVGALPWILGIVGYMGGGILTDMIARRTGKPAAARKGVIVVGLLGTALLMACLGLVTTVPAAVAMMSGVVFLLYLTGSQYFLVISDSIPGKRLGAVVGFVHFIANTAGVLAPVLVGVIVDRTHSWALTFGVCSAICVAGVVALLIWGRTTFIKPA
jgi:ACS family hexuronate transporter-like MFS transporter